jgi:hypothetical protein
VITLNYIQCPKCGCHGKQENFMLMSSPPQNQYTCLNPACKHIWYTQMRTWEVYSDGTAEVKPVETKAVPVPNNVTLIGDDYVKIASPSGNVWNVLEHSAPGPVGLTVHQREQALRMMKDYDRAINDCDHFQNLLLRVTKLITYDKAILALQTEVKKVLFGDQPDTEPEQKATEPEPKQKVTKVVWYARANGIPMGPFDSQVKAAKALWSGRQGIPKDAFVWPVEEEHELP